jgi:DNA replication and repair protein RecF
VRLEKISLYNFKNYEEASLQFTGGIHCFLGKNGSGKTNLLDAIYYLAFTKSALNQSDQQNVGRAGDQFLIKGTFVKGDLQNEISCSYQQGAKKIVRENGNKYPKLSEHIGKYPVVLIAPGDIELIWGGSEPRRRFFDSLLSQIDRSYLENLILYTNILKQRNGLLKLFAEQKKVDSDLMAAYDEKLVQSGEYIFAKRKIFITSFYPLFRTFYEFLIGDSIETTAIFYRTDLEKIAFAEALKKNLDRDILGQRTGAGIHRDDFIFSMNEGELKRTGSQGQQKSFLIALKLAEFQLICDYKQLKPLLLLDDIFDKLDDERIHKLMVLISQGTFGQLFITDARQERSITILKEAGVIAELYLVENASVKKF